MIFVSIIGSLCWLSSLGIIPSESCLQQCTNLRLDPPGSLEVPEDVSDPQDLQLRTSKKATVPGVSKQWWNSKEHDKIAPVLNLPSPPR